MAMRVETRFTAKDGVSKTMGRATKSVDRFGRRSNASFNRASRGARRFKGALSGLKGLMAGIGVAFAARQAKKAVSDFAKAGDEIAKTSRQIGVSAESLQELRFASDRQGVSSATLTKSLQMLNKNIGDSKAGTGALTTYLNKSNPALLKQFKAVKSNDEAFNLYIKEVAKLKTPMEKAAFSQALFGRSGQDLLKLAEAGPDGIKALREEANKYGIVMSTKAANQSEKFVDALTNMKASFKGLGMSALTLFIQPLAKLMQRAADYFSANRDLIATNLKAWFNSLKKVFSMVKPIVSIIWKMRKLVPVILALVAVWKIYTVVMAIVNAISAANPIVLIVLAIIAVIILLILNWDTVKKVFIKGITIIKDVFTAAAMRIKEVFLNIWTAIKNGFVAAFGFIKKVFFTFVDYFLTIYGTIAKTVIKGAIMIGKALGKDVSGLQGAFNKIDSIQKSVRSKSLVGDIQNNINAPNAREAQAKSGRYSGTVNINAPKGSTMSSKKSGYQPVDYKMLGAN